jgi:hypothetical protein
MEDIMTKIKLFEQLAKPNKQGQSRWVNSDEFTGEYEPLQLGNGFSWGRRGSSLDRKYVIETDKQQTPGNSIDRIRLNGFNQSKRFSQTISARISKVISQKKCVIMGIKGKSINTVIEVDHKDGRKEDERVSDTKTQEMSDFQPLTKACNDAKRQICKECKTSGKRWDARNIEGNIIPFYEGDSSLQKSGCRGCYWFDPVEYRARQIEMARQGLI